MSRSRSRNRADLSLPRGVEAIYTPEEAICARCGNLAEHLHHWAPFELFDDADLWPTSTLCGDCHRRWHQVINGNRAQRHGDLGRRRPTPAG